jgi:hypothetical protein
MGHPLLRPHPRPRAGGTPRPDPLRAGPSPWAGNWYYALQLGPLEHKLPPIVSHRWRRVTHHHQRRPLCASGRDQRPLRAGEPGRSAIRETEGDGFQVEREWWIDEEGTAYIVDLALPVEDGWLPVTFGDRPGPRNVWRFSTEAEPEACLQEVQARLRAS